MTRTVACGEPSTQSESRSGGARPSCPRPSGRWHAAQTVVKTVLPAVKRASSAAVSGGGAIAGATPGLPGHSTRSLVEGKGCRGLLERGFQLRALQQRAPAVRLFRKLHRPARGARPGGGGDDAVDERCAASAGRGRLRGRQRDQPFDRRHLTGAKHAASQAGEDLVGLDVGDRPRGIGHEPLDEGQLPIREAAVERVAQEPVARLCPHGLGQRDVRCRVARFAEGQHRLQLHLGRRDPWSTPGRGRADPRGRPPP